MSPPLAFAAALSAGALTMVVVYLIQRGAGVVESRFAGLPDRADRWVGTVALLLAFALLEELVFRRLLQVWAQGFLGLDGAVWFAAVPFGLLHALNTSGPRRWVVAVEATLAGAWFGYAFALTGRLGVAWGLHAGWNLAMWPLFGYPEYGAVRPAITFEGLFETRPAGPWWLSGGEYGPEASVLTIAADLLWAVAIRVLAL